jgi:uncharacterized damage-inducible protein DinB
MARTYSHAAVFENAWTRRVDGSDAAPAEDSLEQHTVAELREIADELGVDHSGLRKAELIDAITAAEEAQGE